MDIYSLGNLIYSIVTGHWPFDNVEEDHHEIRKLVKKGVRPPIDDALRESKDEYVQVMLKAVEMCWPQDPTARATAKEVEHLLAKHLPKWHPSHRIER